MDGDVSRQSDAGCSISSWRQRVRWLLLRRATTAVLRIVRSISGHVTADFRSAGACFVAAAEHLTHGSTEARPGEAVEKEVGGVVGVVEKVCEGTDRERCHSSRDQRDLRTNISVLVFVLVSRVLSRFRPYSI